MAQSIILFDGVCNLCTGAVRFVIERDPTGRFQFASLQSPLGKRLAEQCSSFSATPESILLVEAGRCFTESDAVLRIAKGLTWPWPVVSIGRSVPRAIRDQIYRLIARKRYRWFGKNDACMVPNADLRKRFFDS